MRSKDNYILARTIIASIFPVAGLLILVFHPNISLIDSIIIITLLSAYAAFYYLDKLIPAIAMLFFYPYVIMVIKDQLTNASLLVLLIISALSFPSFKSREISIIQEKRRIRFLDNTYLLLILVALIVAVMIVVVFKLPKLLAPDSLSTRIIELMNAGLLQRTILVTVIFLAILPLMKYLSLLILSIKTQTRLIIIKIKTREIIDLALLILFINILYYPLTTSLIGVTSTLSANPLISVIVSSLVGSIIFIALRRKVSYIPVTLFVLILLVGYLATNTSALNVALNILGVKPIETPLDEALRNTTIVQAEYYRVIVLALQYMGLLP